MNHRLIRRSGGLGRVRRPGYPVIGTFALAACLSCGDAWAGETALDATDEPQGTCLDTRPWAAAERFDVPDAEHWWLAIDDGEAEMIWKHKDGCFREIELQVYTPFGTLPGLRSLLYRRVERAVDEINLPEERVESPQLVDLCKRATKVVDQLERKREGEMVIGRAEGRTAEGDWLRCVLITPGYDVIPLTYFINVGYAAGVSWPASLGPGARAEGGPAAGEAERLGYEYGKLLLLALTLHFQGTCGDTSVPAVAKAQAAAQAAVNELGVDQIILLLREAQLMNGFLDQLGCRSYGLAGRSRDGRGGERALRAIDVHQGELAVRRVRQASVGRGPPAARGARGRCGRREWSTPRS